MGGGGMFVVCRQSFATLLKWHTMFAILVHKVKVTEISNYMGIIFKIKLAQWFLSVLSNPH